MRWWLSFAFALIAVVTAAAVAQFFSQRSESAFRERAQALAVGTSVAAADAVARSFREEDERPQAAVVETAERLRLSLFVFDGEGRLLTSPRSRGADLEDVPNRDQALARVLEGGRYVEAHDDGRVIVVGLRMRNAGEAEALVARAIRPELAAEVAIARDKIVEAALIAVGFGVAGGLLIAMLIAARLRRIARTAAAIEAGSFDEPLEPGFRDELGELAATVDRMRVRLRDSFASIQADRDRLHTLLARLREGVLTVDEELRVDYANPTAGRLLGQGGLESGAPLPDPWPGVSLRALAERLFKEGAVVEEARVVADEDVTIAVVGVPAGPGTQTAILVLADVSERERHERAEREFVTNAAHELRTPLAAIASAVEVLQAGAKHEPVERDRFLASIERQSTRLGRLAHALLTLARAQTRPDEARREVVPVRPLLDDVAAGLVPQPGVEIRVDAAPDLSVLGDRELLQQALGNLAWNAARHTERGTVDLAGRAAPGGAVVLEVRDTGTGMDLYEQERAFERFYQGSNSRAGGFGLGLAIVRQAVRALGGTVELESTPGKGTTVRVAVPGAEREAA